MLAKSKDILTKGHFLSESMRRFLNCPKNVPKNYPGIEKLKNPVHGIDVIMILEFIYCE